MVSYAHVQLYVMGVFCFTKKHIAQHNKFSSRPRYPLCRRVTQGPRTKFRSSAMDQCHWDKTVVWPLTSIVWSHVSVQGLVRALMLHMFAVEQS